MSRSEAHPNLRDEYTVDFHFRLIWRDTPPKPVKEEAEISNGVNKVNSTDQNGMSMMIYDFRFIIEKVS